MKAILTNITKHNTSNFQNIIIEIESWDWLIEKFKEGYKEKIYFKDITNSVYGILIPKYSKVTNLIYDDLRMSCDIELWNGEMVKTLIQKYDIRERE